MKPGVTLPLAGAGTAQDSPDPRRQLAGGERFGNIVISAGIQTLDFLLPAAILTKKRWRHFLVRQFPKMHEKYKILCFLSILKPAFRR